MTKNLKKRSPNRRFARTIERRRLSKTLSDRRPPTLGDFVAAFFQRNLETASPLPPLRNAPRRDFSFVRTFERGRDPDKFFVERRKSEASAFIFRAKRLQ